MPAWIKVSNAARAIGGVTARTIYLRIQSGQLKGCKMGRDWVICSEDFNRILKNGIDPIKTQNVDSPERKTHARRKTERKSRPWMA